MIKTINKELKDKLGDLFPQVEEALKDVDVVIETTANFIPKARFDEVNEKAKKLDDFKDYDDIKAERDQLKTQAEQYADYEELKEKAAKVDEYADYDDLKTKYAESDSTIKRLKLANMGYDKDFVDYALGKIEGDDFDKAAVEYLEANPKLRSETFQQYNSSLDLTGARGKVDFSKITDSDEYLALRKTHDVDGNPLPKK